MAWSFKKRVKIAPGVKLNISKSGISLNLGKKGASVTTGTKGTFLNLGIPGTGLASRTKMDKDNSVHQDKHVQHTDSYVYNTLESGYDDRLVETAIFVVNKKRASAEEIQKELLMGYVKVGSILGQLESIGIVGPKNGTKPRAVLINNMEDLRGALEKVGLSLE